MSKFDPLIQKITDFAQSFEANDNTLREAKTCFFDSIACAFLALEHEKVKNFCSLPYIADSSGTVGVIGTDIKTNVVDATFLNGTLIRWLDFNDTWLAKEWGHPSDNLSDPRCEHQTHYLMCTMPSDISSDIVCSRQMISLILMMPSDISSDYA